MLLLETSKTDRTFYFRGLLAHRVFVRVLLFFSPGGFDVSVRN